MKLSRPFFQIDNSCAVEQPLNAINDPLELFLNLSAYIIPSCRDLCKQLHLVYQDALFVVPVRYLARNGHAAVGHEEVFVELEDLGEDGALDGAREVGDF